MVKFQVKIVCVSLGGFEIDESSQGLHYLKTFKCEWGHFPKCSDLDDILLIWSYLAQYCMNQY